MVPGNNVEDITREKSATAFMPHRSCTWEQ